MYNYNKNEEKTKILLFGKEIEILKKYYYRYKAKEKLTNFFMETFPRWTKFAKTKKQFLKQRWKEINFEDLMNHEYLYFNNGKVQFLVIDIDDPSRKLDDLINLLSEHSLNNKKPNWVVRTRGGWQVGFILKKFFKPLHTSKKGMNSHYKATKYFKSIMNDLYLLYGGDPQAKRIQGFFKNPCWIGSLKNKPVFMQLDRFYDLYELEISKYLPNYKILNGHFFKKNEENLIKKLVGELVLGNIDILKENIEEGIRNSFFWYLGMYISKYDENWEERLKMYNNNIKQPLKNNEFKHIIKSINKYNEENRNFIGLGGYNTWTQELKKEYMKQYRLKKGITKKTKKMQKEESKTKIINAIIKLKKENKKLSTRKIGEVAKLGKTTVAKYLKILKKDEKYKHLFN